MGTTSFKKITLSLLSATSLGAVLLFSSVLSAQSRSAIDVASLGPQIGESVPAFSLSDQFGRIQTLDSIAGPNGTMLLFHRSADW